METRTRFKEDCDAASDGGFGGHWAGLETRTRFKEDCDSAAVSTWELSLVVFLLETRTRFKEDCDRDVQKEREMLISRGWKPGLASKRIATAIANVNSYPFPIRVGWKPGLASKRIATRDIEHARLRFWEAESWKPGLASKRIATLPRPAHQVSAAR